MRPYIVEVTEDHLKLLRRMYFQRSHEELELPVVDDKRPFGDSDYLGSMAEILGDKLTQDHWGDIVFSTEQVEKYERLLDDMTPVVQILAQDLKITPGTYQADSRHSTYWERVE